MHKTDSELPHLSPKIERFCREYVIDMNGAQAAIRAGYSARSAKEQASALLTKPNVKLFVAQLQAELAESTKVKAVDVIMELTKLGFSNIQDYINEDNQIKDLSELNNDKAAAVASIETTTILLGEGRTKKTVKLKLWDKKDALVQLGRHLGIFNDKTDITSNGKEIGQVNLIQLPNGTQFKA